MYWTLVPPFFCTLPFVMIEFVFVASIKGFELKVFILLFLNQIKIILLLMLFWPLGPSKGNISIVACIKAFGWYSVNCCKGQVDLFIYFLSRN